MRSKAARLLRAEGVVTSSAAVSFEKGWFETAGAQQNVDCIHFF